MVRLSALLVALALSAMQPATAQAPDGYREVEAVFNNKLSLNERLVFQDALIAAGVLNAVPTERFNVRLFRSIQRVQQEAGLPATGVPDKAVLDRVFASAASMYRLWSLQRFSHPTRDVSILMPTGMGIEPGQSTFGISLADPAGKIRVRFNHFPDTSLAQNYAELVGKYERNNVKVNFKTIKDGWFVISTTSASGVDGYLRYHADGTGITGFALFWDNAKGDVGGERIATLMSASLWSRMSGAPFADPPSMRPQVVSREAAPSPVTKPLPETPRDAAKPAEPTRTSSGTGFFISKDGFVITNAHVIDGCTIISVQTSDRLTKSARVVATDRTNDLALLKADVSPSRVATIRPAARLGEDIAAFGYPHSDFFASSGNFTVGTITATSGLGDDSRYFQVSAPVHSGNSGGPLLDERGNVVGVVTAKLNAERFAAMNHDSAQNVNFAIKAGMVSGFLDSNGVTSRAEPLSGPRMDRPDLAELARQISTFVACR